MCPKEGILHLPLYVLFDKEVGACALAIEERTPWFREGWGVGVGCQLRARLISLNIAPAQV